MDASTTPGNIPSINFSAAPAAPAASNPAPAAPAVKSPAPAAPAVANPAAPAAPTGQPTTPLTGNAAVKAKLDAIQAQIPGLQKQIQDHLTATSTTVAPPTVPARNQDPAATTTPATPPPPSLAETFKSIRETLAPATAAPATPNLVDTRGTLAASPGGVNDAQTSVANAKTDLQNFEAGLMNEQNRLKGQAIASTIIGGQLVKLDADMAAAYKAKQNAVTQATDQLNQANATLTSIMDLTQKDYQNASQEYNDNFSRNLQLFSAASTARQNDIQNAATAQSEADKQKTEQQNIASANLKTMLDSLAATGKEIDLSKVTDDQKASWNKMELAAGLPVGFTEAAIQANQQGVKVDHWQTDSNTGITYAFGTKNGKPVLLQTFNTGGGGGGGTDGTPVATAGVDTNSNSILAQTGLSIQAFNYLSQGTASLSRLSATARTKIMNEANQWLNKNGIDISTFQSQYKAYNDVLQKNISRANQTQVMAGEVSGSADSLMSAIDQMDWNKVGNIKQANILKLLAGEQVNDATTMKYATQIKFMANDLAGYMAAARGATSPELQDQRDAADLISQGLSKGSVQAFKDSVTANEAKVAGVVNKAVDSTRKQVWGLFGVSDKYKAGSGSTGGSSTGNSSVDLSALNFKF